MLASHWCREITLLTLVAGGLVIVGGTIRNHLREHPASIPATGAAHGAHTTPLVATAHSSAVDTTSEHPGIGETGTPPVGAAVFPDGTWLPPLNGVTSAPEFPGYPRGVGRTFAPVVGISTDPATGMQWYVHEDGTHSTTQMVERTIRGVHSRAAGWSVGSPIPDQPRR